MSTLNLDRRALEAFVIENGDLEMLEAMSREFNLFEAIGAVRRELRHSDLLAFLLDPSQNHGLEDRFLRQFLQQTFGALGDAPLAPADLATLGTVEVRRESSSIDILVLNHSNKFAVVIENKIDSGEHSDQLHRYWTTVESEFPGYRLLGVYLTPDRDEPSDNRYVSIDYGLVAKLVKDFVDAPASTVAPDVKTVLHHYERMLRRHIVSDSDIAQRCREIYQKHKRALDLIYEHRPDPRQGAVRKLVEMLLQERTDLLPDLLPTSSKKYLGFTPKSWDVPKWRIQQSGGTKTERILGFNFVFESDRVYIHLVLGPGPASVRGAIFKVAQERPELFKARKLGSVWTFLFQRPILDAKALTALEESGDAAPIESALREQWTAFTTRDLPAIVAAFEAEANRAS